MRTVLLFVLASVGTALADDTVVQVEGKVPDYAERVIAMNAGTYAAMSNGYILEPANCTDTVKAALAANPGSTKVKSSQFKGWPGAVAKDDYAVFITLDDAKAICDQYVKHLPMFRALQAFAMETEEAAQKLRWLDLVKPGEGSSGREVAMSPERCKKAVEGAKAAGVAGTAKVKTKDTTYALDEVKTKLCDALATNVPAYIEKEKVIKAAELKQKMAPFAKAGIKGKRLELFAQYWGVYWRLPGGKRTDDPAELAKAKVAFQWLEITDPVDASYVINTVRRYAFKGNDYTISEKTYRTKRGDDVPSSAWK